MEKITGKQVETMMEAYASIYNNQEQEVISEETQELQENQANRDKQRELRQKQMSGRAQQQFGAKPRTGSFRDRIRDRRSQSATAQANTNKAGQTFTPAQVAALKKPAAPTVLADKAPSANPNVTPGGTKFERRLPTSAELRAAQSCKDAAKVLSRGEIEKVLSRQLLVFLREPLLILRLLLMPRERQNLLLLQAKAKADTMNAKPAANTSRMGARNRMRMEEVDIFDTIKEYLIGEGATEEEALKQMLQLTDEQRTEILEGSCGSKMKKKKKGGYCKCLNLEIYLEVEQHLLLNLS